MDMLNALKTQSTGSREKTPYTLDEVLAIIYMFTAEQLKPSQVAEITGRSVHSLRYKFLEGEIVLNGKKQIRSMKRFNSTQEIFEHYKATWIGDADIQSRITNFKQELLNKTTAA